MQRLPLTFRSDQTNRIDRNPVALSAVEPELLQQVERLPASDRLRAKEVFSKGSEYIQRLNADGPAFVHAAIAADVVSVVLHSSRNRLLLLSMGRPLSACNR